MRFLNEISTYQIWKKKRMNDYKKIIKNERQKKK